MARRRRKRNRKGYVLAPSVTHPQGRERAFEDMFKAVVRVMIEVNNNPMMGYAIDKTDRIATESNIKLLSDDDLDDWDEACEEYELMSPEEQQAWIAKVLSSYPRMAELPDLDSYNDIN